MTIRTASDIDSYGSTLNALHSGNGDIGPRALQVNDDAFQFASGAAGNLSNATGINLQYLESAAADIVADLAGGQQSLLSPEEWNSVINNVANLSDSITTILDLIDGIATPVFSPVDSSDVLPNLPDFTVGPFAPDSLPVSGRPTWLSDIDSYTQLYTGDTSDITAQGNVPTAPTLDLDSITFPTSPTDSELTFPTAPTTTDIVVPDAPDLVIPTFDGVAPELDNIQLETTGIVNTVFDPYDDNAVQSMLTELLSTIRSDLADFDAADEGYSIDTELDTCLTCDTGDTALAEVIDTVGQLWSKTYDLEQGAVEKELDDVFGSFERRGYHMPSGAMLQAMLRLKEDMIRKVCSLGREQAVAQQEVKLKLATLAKEYKQLLIDKNRVKVETKKLTYQKQALLVDKYKTALQGYLSLMRDSMQHHIQLQQLKAEAEQFNVRAAIDIFNARLSVIQYAVDIYKAKAQVYQTLVDAERARIAIYTAQVDAERAKAEIDQLKVQIYTAQLDAVKTKVQVYTERVNAATAQLQGEKLKIETYAEEVRSIGVLADAKLKQWQAAEQKLTVDNFAKLRGVDVITALSKVDVDTNRVAIDYNNSEIQREQVRHATTGADYANVLEKERLILSAITTELQAQETQAQVYSSTVKAYTDKINGAATAVSAQASVSKDLIDASLAQLQSDIERARLKADTTLKANVAAVDAYARLTASALNIMNVGSNSSSSGTEVLADNTSSSSSSNTGSV